MLLLHPPSGDPDATTHLTTQNKCPQQQTMTISSSEVENSWSTMITIVSNGTLYFIFSKLNSNLYSKPQMAFPEVLRLALGSRILLAAVPNNLALPRIPFLLLPFHTHDFSKIHWFIDADAWQTFKRDEM